MIGLNAINARKLTVLAEQLYNGSLENAFFDGVVYAKSNESIDSIFFECHGRVQIHRIELVPKSLETKEGKPHSSYELTCGRSKLFFTHRGSKKVKCDSIDDEGNEYAIIPISTNFWPPEKASIKRSKQELHLYPQRRIQLRY